MNFLATYGEMAAVAAVVWSREGMGGAEGEEWKCGGWVRDEERGGEGAAGWARRKVVISQLLINILRLRAFQRNVIN